MGNLDLWDKVQKTDPKHVKPITGKSYQGTSPKPHYLIHKATETFGPIGIGWGFTIENERIEEGAGGERMSIARVKVWYKWEGERGEVEHIGGTSFSGTRKNGTPFTDEDAPKKSVTDALVKALSMIGFAGDIFMGRYDDSKYVSELQQEAKEAARPVERAKTFAAYGATITAAKTPDELKDAFAAIWKSSLSQEDKDTLKTAYEAKKVELANPGYVAPSFDNLQSEHHGDRL